MKCISANFLNENHILVNLENCCGSVLNNSFLYSFGRGTKALQYLYNYSQGLNKNSYTTFYINCYVNLHIITKNMASFLRSHI